MHQASVPFRHLLTLEDVMVWTQQPAGGFEREATSFQGHDLVQDRTMSCSF